MKNQLTYLLVLLFIVSVSGIVFGQNQPINFESGGYGATWTWTVFENGTNPPLEIIPNPDPSGANTSATVAKFTALQTGNPWAGCESAHGASNLGPFVLGASNSIIKIMVWKSVISDVGIKLVSTNGWSQGEIKVANTLVNQWEELTFNFSSFINPPPSEGPLDQIVVFPDFNLAGRTQNNIIYFDNITFSAGTPSNVPVLPLDFESGTINYTFTDFDGGGTTKIANPYSGGINTSANVARMVKSAGQVWGGSWIGMATPIDFSVNKTFKVKVYMPRVGAKLLLKVENASNPGISFEKEATGTVANAWEELTFDYSAINVSNQYQHLIFIFDNGTMGTGTADFTYLFDDVKLVAGTPSNLPVLPLDFESGTITYTFNDFDGGGTTKIANPYSGGINTSANVARMVKSAGQVWGGSWIGLATPIDFSVNKAFKVKVYMPRVGAKLLLKVENASNPGISFEKEATGTVANAWEELTFDYSAINVSNQYQHLVFIFDNGTMGTGTADFTYLFDDIKLVQPTSVEGETEIPMDYSLSQNFPNPFNPTTNISFNLPKASNVSLKVYDMLGQEVATVLNQFMNAGRFEVKFDASSLSTGIYTYSLSAGNFQSVKKMILIK